MEETIFLQGQDARQFLKTWFCESCLSSARNWAELDKRGNLEVPGMYDERGELVGFLCPSCAKLDNK